MFEKKYDISENLLRNNGASARGKTTYDRLCSAVLIILSQITAIKLKDLPLSQKKV